MHIHHDMYGYSNAVWGAPATQADGPLGARWASTDDGANGAPVTQNAPEDAAPTGGGNPILQALAQALESLGLSLSAPATNSTSANPASSSDATTTATPAATTTAASVAPAASATTAVSSASSPAPAPAPAPRHEISSEERTIAGDVRHLMHALFEDVRAENLLAPSSGSGSGSSTPGSSFASGLAALISQVQSGSAPANLQRAFDALVANLSQVGTQSAPGAASDSTAAAAAIAQATPGNSAPVSNATTTPSSAAASASTAAPASTLNTQALLVQFLTNLQTDLGLGYGGSTGTPAQSATSGVMVNTAA
jgi:hypothetical protein